MLADVFAGSTHVSVLGPDPDDESIWDHAKANDLTIVSKDSDSYRMSVLLGAPPKVVWVRIGNGPTRHVEEMLRSRAADLATFIADADAALLIIEQA